MRKTRNIDQNNDLCEKPNEDFILEQLNNNSDERSMEIFRKLAFLKLLDASKRYHLEKLQGKGLEELEKARKTVSGLYSDYKQAKYWTEAK